MTREEAKREILFAKREVMADSWIDKAYDVAIKALEQPEQRWIPCKERMPNKDGVYLVSGRWASGKESVGDCDYSKDDGYFHVAWNFDVLAWMPLPEPYGGEQDDSNKNIT